MKLLRAILLLLAALTAAPALAAYPGEGQSTVYSVYNTPGIDCTGATDSSVALNTLFASISGKHVRLINGTATPCHMVVYQQLHILNAIDFWLDGDSETYGQGMTISGCGTPLNTLNGSNAVLYVNASFHWRMSGLLIEANGNTRCSAASTFTVSLQRDNTPGTQTDTDSTVDHNTFTSSVNGNGIYRFSNYRGILESAVNGNGENLRVYDNNFLCQQSPASWAIDIAGPFADMFDVRHNVFSYCMIDVFDNGSQGRVEDNQAEAPGNYADFGAGGAFFYLAAYCPYGYDKIVISGNETDNSGPLFSNATDATASGGACVGGDLTIADNLIGANQLAPNTPAINVQNTAGVYIVTGNILKSSNLPTFPMIGTYTNSQPYGTLIAYGNWRDGDTGPIYFTSAAGANLSPLPTKWNVGSSYEGNFTSQWTSNDYRFIPPYAGTAKPSRSAAIGFEAQSTTFVPNDYWMYNYISASATTYPFTMVFDAEQASLPVAGAVAMAGPISGALNVVATVAAPTMTGASIYVPNSGSTTYTYKLVGVGSNQCTTAASTALTTTTGNATLSGTNYNLIQLPANDYGLIGYKVYRTASGGSPSTTGYIGWDPIINSSTDLPPVTVPQNGGGYPGENVVFLDTGLAGDSTIPPTVSTCTGAITAANLAGSGTQCVQASNAGVLGLSGSGCGSGGGSTSFPQTVSGTTTSGGVPYFSNTTTLSSSAALAANAVVIGGGAGAAPSTTTTGTGVLTAFGNATNATGGIATWPVAVSTGVSGLGSGTATALALAPNTTGGLATYPTAGGTNSFWVNPVASYNASGLITSGQGSCSSGSASLSITFPGNINGFKNGMGIKVVGAGSGGSNLNTTISSGAGTFTFTLATNCLTTVTSANINTIGSISSGTSVLTVASTTGWVTGEGIDVAGAGSAGADLITTATVTSGTVLSLGANASTSVTNAVVNHDDTAALSAALATALNVYIPLGQYNVTSALTISTPQWVQCAGSTQGQYNTNSGTLIWNRGSTNNTVVVSSGGAHLEDCGIQQAVDITPTAGYGLVLGNGSSGSQWGFSGSFIDHNSVINTYGLLDFNEGVTTSTVSGNSIMTTSTATKHIVTYDVTSPGGANFITGNAFADYSGQNLTCITITDGDTNQWVNNNFEACGTMISATTTPGAFGNAQMFMSNTFEGSGSGTTCQVVLSAGNRYMFSGNYFNLDNGHGTFCLSGTVNQVLATGNLSSNSGTNWTSTSSGTAISHTANLGTGGTF